MQERNNAVGNENVTMPVRNLNGIWMRQLLYNVYENENGRLTKYYDKAIRRDRFVI